MSNLLQRILFALVAAPAAIVVLVLGDWALAGALAVLAALAAWEFFRIAGAAGYAPIAPIGIPLAALLPLAAHSHTLRLWSPSPALALVLVLGALAAALWTRGVESRPLGASAATMLGVLYTGGCFSYAYLLRHHPYAIDDRGGAALAILPFLLTWTSDTAGYAVGRAIGRRKLMPSVSPGKTVEGAIGALALTMLMAWAYTTFVLRPQAQLAMRFEATLLFGALVSAAVQIGDLVESLLKREAGVKDSSTLLPGHGGVLDRFDGLLFALPVSYLLLRVLLIPAPR